MVGAAATMVGATGVGREGATGVALAPGATGLRISWACIAG